MMACEGTFSLRSNLSGRITMGRYFASVINSNRIVWTGLSDVLWLK